MKINDFKMKRNKFYMVLIGSLNSDEKNSNDEELDLDEFEDLPSPHQNILSHDSDELYGHCKRAKLEKPNEKGNSDENKFNSELERTTQSEKCLRNADPSTNLQENINLSKKTEHFQANSPSHEHPNFSPNGANEINKIWSLAQMANSPRIPSNDSEIPSATDFLNSRERADNNLFTSQYLNFQQLLPFLMNGNNSIPQFTQNSNLSKLNNSPTNLSGLDLLQLAANQLGFGNKISSLSNQFPNNFPLFPFQISALQNSTARTSVNVGLGQPLANIVGQNTPV